ncbi:hypothetical protein KP79_PYT09611 [Mizuhopecten yessoensis]|uniref:SGNH hydrolase-type esterase domain-containing protein n=1 Tax=Mizuhopecten yessoensis TaxID=6573 RepID=A0A210QMW9_MIZYE|nr:hypothetical protein KP79_PYT09611 [Mizuhopecten yessoensis]
MRFAIVGHSFIARMAGNSLLQSDDVQLIGIRGATARTLLLSKKIRDLDDDRVFLQIGGNDIGPTSDPDDIVSDICDVVAMFVEKGCQVIVGSLFQRYRPRHMSPEKYEIQRTINTINTRLCELFKTEDNVTNLETARTTTPHSCCIQGRRPPNTDIGDPLRKTTEASPVLQSDEVGNYSD